MQRQLERHRPAPEHDPDDGVGLPGGRTRQLQAQGREAAQKAEDVTKKVIGREARLVDAMKRQDSGQ